MPLDDTNWPPPDAGIDETTDLLIRARGFIKRGWCRDRQARNRAWNDVDPKSERAVAWCAYGALVAAGMNGPMDWYEHPAVVRFHAVVGGERIDDFNNRQETVEPVLAAFDRAIGAGVRG